MEQNYIDAEYESKLEFQSLWDDLKNKVWKESSWARAGREGREKCSRPLEVLETPNQHNQENACTPTAFCNFVEIGWEEPFWNVKEMHFKAKRHQGGHLASPWWFVDEETKAQRNKMICQSHAAVLW